VKILSPQDSQKQMKSQKQKHFKSVMRYEQKDKLLNEPNKYKGKVTRSINIFKKPASTRNG